jgi:cysteinyl-tRNA synthetase
LDWSDDSIESARRKLDRLYGALQGVNIPENFILESDVPEGIILALEDDLNSPLAISVLFNLARDLNKATDQDKKLKIAALLILGGQFMGLLNTNPDEWFTEVSEGSISAEEIEKLIRKRQAAKEAKDFKTADKIRNQLLEVGIKIQDGRDGTSWRRNKL